MKLSDAYPSKYLSAADLNGQDVTVTIDGAELEEFDGDGRSKEKKVVLSFRGKKKAMICNKTNFNTIVKVLGYEDTDDWIGKSITIGPREVEFGGEMVWSLRVSLKVPGSAPTPQRQAPSPTPAPTPVTAQNEDDSVPF